MWQPGSLHNRFKENLKMAVEDLQITAHDEHNVIPVDMPTLKGCSSFLDEVAIYAIHSHSEFSFDP